MNARHTMLLILFALGSAITSYAQKRGQEAIDSLLSELPGKKEDSNKVNILYRLGGNYLAISPEKAIGVGEQALQLSEKIKWNAGMAKGRYCWVSLTEEWQTMTRR